RLPAAVHLESRPGRLLAQVVRQFEDTVGDVGDANLEQEFQAGAEGSDPGHVRRPALPAAGVRLEGQLDSPEVPGVAYAVPADSYRMQPIDQLPPDVEDGGTFRAEQPLVAVGRQEIDRGLPDVQGEYTQALDGIDEEVHSPLTAQVADRVQ